MRLLRTLHLIAGVTVALPTTGPQGDSSGRRVGPGYDANPLIIPVATGLAVTLANELAKGAYKYVRSRFPDGWRSLSRNKEVGQFRDQWTEEDQLRCIKEMVRPDEHFIFPARRTYVLNTQLSYMPLPMKPEDDDDLYRLYKSYMQGRDPGLAMKVSYQELLLDALCSSREAMFAGRARLVGRLQTGKDNWQAYSLGTSALGTIKRVGASIGSTMGAASRRGTLAAPLLKGMPAPILVP